MQEGQRLQFYCSGSSSVALRKNGVLFSDGRLYSGVRNGVASISIRSANVTDSGSYQCASGNITSNSIFVSVITAGMCVISLTMIIYVAMCLFEN